MAAGSQSLWIPVCTVRNEGCGQSQPMTGELRNAGGASPPQMKPLNYHVINIQTSAKLGLNQISHWGPSGGGESSRRGAHQAWTGRTGGCRMKRWVSTGTQVPQGLLRGPGNPPLPCLAWGPAPIEGSRGLWLKAAVSGRVSRPVS